ncbi:MAG TPA: hypothetical protein VMM18_13790 [Gemmatimonadaceae bacterium]|nr:hypothetical protein [Gemmatimonadaceae bacterium]
MRCPDRILADLRARGELWEVAPGLIGLRGDLLSLYRAVERTMAGQAALEGAEEWLAPPAIPLESLERGEYFDSFPQWLTLAAHLRDDASVLEDVARNPHPAAAARDAAAPAGAALQPAVCWHAYVALAGTFLTRQRTLTLQGSCWRHEGARLQPLARGWAFTMREIVAFGTSDVVEAFRQRGVRRAVALAGSFGLEATVAAASDPFFAPTARGKALLQRVKALKHELVVQLGDGRALAVASFNHHEDFFGDRFDIRLADGGIAASGCVAYGIERWVLAIVAAHGPDAAGWPVVGERA